MRRSPRLASRQAALSSSSAEGGGGGGAPSGPPASRPPTRQPGAATQELSGPELSPSKARYYRSVTPQKRSRHSSALSEPTAAGALGRGAPDAVAGGRADDRRSGAPAGRAGTTTLPATPPRETPLPAEDWHAPIPENSPCPERPGATASLLSSSSVAGPSVVHAPEEMPVGLIQITPRRPVPDIAARILSKSPSSRSERRVSLAEKVMTRNTVLNIKNFVEAPEKLLLPPKKPETPARVLDRTLFEREREPASATDNGDDADTGLMKLNAFERIDQENDPNAVVRKERRQSRVTFAKTAHVRFFNKDASPSPRGPRRSSKIGLQSPGRSPSHLSFRDNKEIVFEMPDLGSTNSAVDNPFDLRLSLEGNQEGNESESDFNDVSMELSSCDGGIRESGGIQDTSDSPVLQATMTNPHLDNIQDEPDSPQLHDVMDETRPVGGIQSIADSSALRAPVLNPRPLSSIEDESESPQLHDVMDETRPVGGIESISEHPVRDHTDNISGLIDFGRPTFQSPSNSGRASISTRYPPLPNFTTVADNGRRDTVAGRFSLGDCEAMDETICVGGIRLSSVGGAGAHRLSLAGTEATEDARSVEGIHRSSVGLGAAHRLSLAGTAAIGDTRCVEGARRSSVGANAADDDTFSSIFEGDDVFSPQAPGRSSVASPVLDHEGRSSQLPSRTPSIGIVVSPMVEQLGARQRDSRSSIGADRRMSTGTVRRRERAIAPAETRRHTLAGSGHSYLASGPASHAHEEMFAAAQDVSLIVASASAMGTCELDSLKLDEVLVKSLDEQTDHQTREQTDHETRERADRETAEQTDHETTEQDNRTRDLCNREVKSSNASTASAVDEDAAKDFNEQTDVAFETLANEMEAPQDNRTESLSNKPAEASPAHAANAVSSAELEALKQDEVWLTDVDEHIDLVYKDLTNTTDEARAEISKQDKRAKDISDRSAKASDARKENMSQIKVFRDKIERLKQQRVELEVMKQKLEVRLAEKREVEEAARRARAKLDEEALALQREREAVERVYNEKRESLVRLAEVDLRGDDVLGTWKLVGLEALVMVLECRGRVRAQVDLSKDRRTMLISVVDQADYIAAWVTTGEGCCDLGENAGENGMQLDRAVEVLRRVGARLRSAEKVESDVRRVCRMHPAEVRVCGDALVSEICFVGMEIEAKLLLQLWLSPEGCWGYDQKLCYGQVNLFDLAKVLSDCGTPGVLAVANAVNKWWEEIDRRFP